MNENTKVNPLLPNSESNQGFFGGAVPFFSKERGCVVGGSNPLRPNEFFFYFLSAVTWIVMMQNLVNT